MAATGMRFDSVWKRFRRGAIHDSLRDLLPALAKRIVGAGRPVDQLSAGDFWAVEDVSFEVGEGETLGIIGGNGAGKSTILKILTGILRPTKGYYDVRGRVGALIEIAAGFHDDLTGRENIFLQGAIRGMPTVLIRKQFDSIVEFSGIEDFIDTPVKRYSSGMNARLGFAIAAHLNPEVLIIDEVLSVGDFGFQIRAFSRIHEMATSGIPVVIVSHQLDRITELCTKAILLDHGKVIAAGSPAECITRYTRGGEPAPDTAFDGPAQIRSIKADSDLSVRSGAQTGIRITGRFNSGATSKDGDSVLIRVITAQFGYVAYETTTARLGVSLPIEGDFTLHLRLQMNLPPGVYRIETAMFSESLAKVVSGGPSINVQVAEGQGFQGRAQLNPQVELT